MDAFSVGIGLRDLRNPLPQPKLRLPRTIQQTLSRRLLVLERFLQPLNSRLVFSFHKSLRGLCDLLPQPKLRLPRTIQQILSRRLLVLERFLQPLHSQLVLSLHSSPLSSILCVFRCDELRLFFLKLRLVRSDLGFKHLENRDERVLVRLPQPLQVNIEAEDLLLSG